MFKPTKQAELDRKTHNFFAGYINKSVRHINFEEMGF